ncbi:MAG: universal stress protein [Oligosphaeraceae bacterium]
MDNVKTTTAFLNRLLLVVDGSAESENATAFALKMARALPCELIAAYVVDTATMDYLQQMRIFVSEERAELEDAINAKGQAYLQRTRMLAKAANIPLDTTILRGRFSNAVLQLLRQRDVQAVVIGGRKGLYRHKDAFTVERELLLDQSPVPVMVVK